MLLLLLLLLLLSGGRKQNGNVYQHRERRTNSGRVHVLSSITSG